MLNSPTEVKKKRKRKRAEDEENTEDMLVPYVDSDEELDDDMYYGSGKVSNRMMV